MISKWKSKVLKTASPAALQWLVAVTVFLNTALLLESPGECTGFAVADNGRVFFANNIDVNPDQSTYGTPVIEIYPATDAGFGYIEFSLFYEEERRDSREGAVNEAGLVYASMTVPPQPLNGHPDRAIRGFNAFFEKMLREASTVEEAVRIARQSDFYDLGGEMGFQMLIADAAGDAVVLGPGLGGEIVFVRKPEDQAFLIASNFNRGIPPGRKERGQTQENYGRFKTAETLLESSLAAGDLSVVSVTAILEAVHVESLISHTYPSRVIELGTGEITFYYLAQFDDGVRMSISDLLSQGKGRLYLRDLIPGEVVSGGEAAYRFVRIRDIAAGSTALFSLVAWVVAWVGSGVLNLRKCGKKTRGLSPWSHRWKDLAAFSWIAFCVSTAVFICNTYPPNLLHKGLPVLTVLVCGTGAALALAGQVRRWRSRSSGDHQFVRVPG